ncbi:MAG: hypothetical protein U0996_15460 [Planctomycetaceae bacterium]
MRSVFKALARSMSQWWHADRIRVASSEGRLLRIRTGQRVLILGRMWNVESSNIEQTEVAEPNATQGRVLLIQLRNCDSTDAVQTAILEVTVPPTDATGFARTTAILTTGNGSQSPVTDGDIVFS